MKASWKATFLGMSQLEFAFSVSTCTGVFAMEHFGSLGFPSIESQMSNGILMFWVCEGVLDSNFSWDVLTNV